MSTPTAVTAPTLRQVAGWFPAWLRSHPVAALTSVVVGGAFSYAWNVWLIAMLYRGAHRVPVGAPATGSRNFIYGGLFWALCGMLIFGLASYWHAVGTRRFFTEFQALPLKLAGLIRRDHAARVHLLWGAALAMLLAVVLSPSVGLILAIGLVTVAPGFLGSILSAFLARVWSRLITPFWSTRRANVAGITGVAVGLIGAAAALVAAFLIGSTAIKLIVVAVLAALALALSRVGPASTGAMLVVIGVLLVLSWVTNPALAFAAPGGSPDCPCTAGLKCMAEPATLSNSIVGSITGALGAVGGAVLGGLASAANALGGGGDQGGPPASDSSGGSPQSTGPLQGSVTAELSPAAPSGPGTSQLVSASGPDASQATGQGQGDLPPLPDPISEQMRKYSERVRQLGWPTGRIADELYKGHYFVPLGGPEQGARALQAVNLMEHMKASKADSHSIADALQNPVWVGLGKFLAWTKSGAGVGVNTISAFLGPYGLPVTIGYSALKDLVGDYFESGISSKTWVNIGNDTVFNAIFSFTTQGLPDLSGGQGKVIVKQFLQAVGFGAVNEAASTTTEHFVKKMPLR